MCLFIGSLSHKTCGRIGAGPAASVFHARVMQDCCRNGRVGAAPLQQERRTGHLHGAEPGGCATAAGLLCVEPRVKPRRFVGKAVLVGLSVPTDDLLPLFGYSATLRGHFSTTVRLAWFRFQHIPFTATAV